MTKAISEIYTLLQLSLENKNYTLLSSQIAEFLPFITDDHRSSLAVQQEFILLLYQIISTSFELKLITLAQHTSQFIAEIAKEIESRAFIGQCGILDTLVRWLLFLNYPQSNESNQHHEFVSHYI
jgi:hypothetical protein